MAKRVDANLFCYREIMATTGKNGWGDQGGYNWKRRPSEIRGYMRALYLTSDNNDYIRVDYNIRDRRVRLYMEIASEGGNPYYAVITDGKITAERSVSSGRSFGFADKFRSRAEIFSSIPNRDVVRLINGNYDISEDYERKRRAEEKARELETIKKRYFRKEDTANPYTETGKDETRVQSVRVSLVDFIDITIGAALAAGSFYLMQYSYITMGVVCAFYGLGIGLVDIAIRERQPVFTKMIIFIMAGFVSYVYGYYLM